MFANVLDVLFGCWHKNYSFPITIRKENRNLYQASSITGTYVVCLDCGKEFPYDWKQMKVLSANSPGTEPATLTAEAATDFVKAA